MIIFPNCKINLGLHILRKRNDGYHDLETVFYPLPFFDIVELIPSADDAPGVLFSTSGTVVEINNDDNLCVKAYELLKKNHPELPSVKIHLHKTIPSGAGLGGGSADAAFTLLLLNKRFSLQLTDEQLLNYALQLGSDCPFFIRNKPVFATGRGERIETISLDLSAYQFVLVNPGIHINTAKAFTGIKPCMPVKSIKEIIQQPIERWKNELQNDFEKTVFSRHPSVGEIKNKLYEAGAIYASMSGSGSTVYGIFKKGIVPSLQLPSHYFIKQLAG